MMVLHVDFTLRMASSKWKTNIQILWQKVVICHPLCHNINMWKLLAILVVIFWLILRDDNAVLISLITKKHASWVIMEPTTYVILPPKCIKFPQDWMVKLFFRNNSYATSSLWNTSNLGESVLYCSNNKTGNVQRVYFHNKSIHRG